MSYQKTKHVEAAQKFLHQGKIPQAVAEYLVILKHEPKDQVTLMTVGDLYVRQGETFQALEYFERLAQIYLADGFLTKAIAIYKKVAKLAPEEMRPIERLADLYVQQGVMSEARPIYLQMADMHQRANRPAQAIGLLRKLLDAEPDNVRVQGRLADLLVAGGQKSEAVAALRTAAQQLLRKGDNAEAVQFTDRALKIDPADEATLALRARALIAAGKQSDAVGMLESLPDVDAGGETSTLLVDLYLDAGETPRAAALAERIFARDSKRYPVVQQVAEALLEKNDAERALALLQLVCGAVLNGGDHEHFSELLGRTAEALPGRIEPRQMLVDLFGHTSDSFRLPDALIHLAEAYEAAGQLEPALQAYAQFLGREPENEAVRRKQERLQARMGLLGTEAGSGAGAGTATGAATQAPPDFAVVPMGEAPEPGPATLPLPENSLDEETQVFVGQAITDVDLYSSYGLTQKALDLLEIVLQRSPDHTGALERLLDLSLGMGNDSRAAELASRLEQIYTQCGDKSAADRFADLRRRFERSASAAPAQESETPLPAPSSVAVAPSAPATSPVTVSPMEFQIPVVDAQAEAYAELNDAQAQANVADAAPEPVVHEVDLSEEWAALISQKPESPVPFSAEIAEEAELAASAPVEVLPVDELPPASPIEQSVSVSSGSQAEELFADYELALDGAAAGRSVERPPDNVDSFIRSISAELDAILPPPAEMPPAPAPVPVEFTPPPAKPVEPRGPLGDLFEEFRADLGENEKEDPETHYNLGIAYREMGLMEESISEFQKVATAHQQGHAFRYAMQCYTLLALAFVDKGQPSIAVSWYERALLVPGLDPETVLSLRYDLGISQEMSGDIEAAHKSFSQVYGTNIDYRDVAERLAALGRTR